jgi:ribosomal protein S18 acetylase RimI-like enzyme
MPVFKEFVRYNKSVSLIRFDFLPNLPELWIKFFETHVRSRTKLALVAEHKGKLIGYLLGGIQKRPPIFKIREQGFVSDLAVTASKRNKGIGTRLMKEFDRWAKKKGLKLITLNVFPKNEPGIKFYKKRGYVPVALVERKTL